jgi:ACS family D-galactonate transporter-like MFS transporter
MPMVSSSFESPLQNRRWRLVALLSLSVFINYVDRGNLSVAAPVLTRELSLSPAQLGLLFSAFFWTYSLCQIPAGWLADRVNLKLLYAAAYTLWSVVTLVTGFTHSISALLIVRLFLGLGESVAYPACSQILVSNFSEHERGRANSLIEVGAKSGPALGTLLGGLVVAYWGWRVLFVAAGAIGLLWLVPWYFCAETGERVPRESSLPSPSFFHVLGRRDTFGTSLGMFCYGYAWYFLLSWLPYYLVVERHLSVRAMAVVGALPFCGSALSVLVCGWASDRLIARGASVTRVRKSFVVGGLLLCTLMLPAAMVRDTSFALVLLAVVSLAAGLFSSNVWAITQTLAGRAAAGKWTGIQNATGNLGGVVSPLMTGLIVSRTHSFFLAFACAAAALVIGAGAYLFLVGKVMPLTWQNGHKSTALIEETTVR